MSDDDREWLDERAAILEFDAGYSRDVANTLAMIFLAKWKKAKDEK